MLQIYVILIWLSKIDNSSVSVHFVIVSGQKEEAMYASVGDALLWEENSVKLLAIFTDSRLSFDIHVQTIYKKASQKLTVILRLANINYFTGKENIHAKNIF